jgi:hypothetical protein
MYPVDPAGYTRLMREPIIILKDEYPEVVGVTASGIRDTTDYAELIRQAHAADRKSKFDTYPGTD